MEVIYNGDKEHPETISKDSAERLGLSIRKKKVLIPSIAVILNKETGETILRPSYEIEIEEASGTFKIEEKDGKTVRIFPNGNYSILYI